MKSFLLIIAVIVCSVTGLPAALYDNERIFGGEVAASGDFPYVVSITENDRHFYGGFIYSARWIVTTASCVVGKTASKLKVVVGQTNDIALLKLTADIVFDYVNVDFVAYNELDNSLPVVVMGWGATFDGGLESVNLRSGEVSVNLMTKDSPCGEYASPQFNFATMICASNNPAATTIAPPSGVDIAGSPCQYDEGSPMVQDVGGVATAIGILSRTDGCSTDSYGVYTRISVFYSWLVNTAGQQPIRPTP